LYTAADGDSWIWPLRLRRYAKTRAGTGDMEGDFYVVEIPRKGLRKVQITWLDGRGRAAGAGMYVPGTLRYGSRSQEPQPPH
jgi:hypothetical protein